MTTQNYFSHLRQLVALELEEERRAYQRSLEDKGLSFSASIREPACRYPVRLGNTAYNPMGQLTLELRYEVGEDEVELDFEPGKPVTMFYMADNGAKELQHQCYVKRVGDGMMIGVSAHSVEEAIKAVRNGADCLGVGAMFSTSTKTDVDVLPKETLKAICEAVDVPVVAIGGIGKGNMRELAGTGVDGFAIVSAIFGADDIEKACRELRQIAEETVGE